MNQSTARLLLALSFVLGGAACAKDTPDNPTEPTLDRSRDQVSVEADDRDDQNDDRDDDDRPFTLALIGDTPYGQQKRDSFPALISLINADPQVERVIHIGDIKAGKNTLCTDAYFADIKAQFDTFQDPLVYTPGDNEWTDCHAGKKNGSYTPTERLQAVRALFFATPGRTLGINSRKVRTQANDPANAQYVENVLWTRKGVTFATLNITGSNNDKNPWGALPGDAGNYPSQATEQATRAQANAAWLAQTFALASRRHAKAVVIGFQANMWDPAETIATLDGYDALVQQLGTLAAQFGKPVLLIMGDSHKFNVDNPYSAGASVARSLHASSYPVAENLTRLVVEGSDKGRTEYTRLTIDPKSSTPFTFVRVPLDPNAP